MMKGLGRDMSTICPFMVVKGRLVRVLPCGSLTAHNSPYRTPGEAYYSQASPDTT